MTVQTDMRELMEVPAFRRFMFRLIQSSGILTQGANGRDLNFIEGRRSLCFDALRDAENGLHEDTQTPLCIMTWLAILREAGKPQKKVEKDSDE